MPTNCTTCNTTTVNCSNPCSQDNPCGKKYTTDDVVYNGVPLTCTDIQPCDTLTTVLEKFTNYVCSQAFTTVIINNIVNNTTILQQFTELVNQVVDCEVVNNCINPSTGPFTFTISNAHESSINACFDNEIAFTLYSNTEFLNPLTTVLYTDVALTVPFNGGGFIYHLIPTSLDYEINTFGQVKLVATCNSDLDVSEQTVYSYKVNNYDCNCVYINDEDILNSQILELNKWYTNGINKFRVESLNSISIGTPTYYISPLSGEINCNNLTC